MNNFNDTFLARWMVDDVTEKEMEAFKLHPDYKAFKKIKDFSSNLSFTEFNEDASFEVLQKKINTHKKTKKSNVHTWLTAIAACLIITLSFLFFNDTNKVFKTGIAQHKNIDLPDGSVMILNASSKASINLESWVEDRTVFLTGEAFFKVEKGAKFTVKTKKGIVEVLGTKFTVNTIKEDFLGVKCFEGKVKVTTAKSKILLTKGNAFQEYKNNVDKWLLNNEVPRWLKKEETIIHKMPIHEVMALMKRQYDLSIKGEDNLDKSLLFTGKFTNNNLSKALYSVLGTLNVNYEMISSNEIHIVLE